MQQAVADERLLRALAEQLKLPFLQIARQTELYSVQHPELRSVTSIAESSLRFIDSFLLSLEAGQQALQLEPISVSSVLYEAAQVLEPAARKYNCELEVQLSGKYGPVMANRKSLEAALVMLGHSFIEAYPDTMPHKVVLGAHRSAQGLVTGLFHSQKLTTDMLRRGRALHGQTQQAIPALSSTAAAGIFVADKLFTQMAAPLHVARHSSLSGLATTLMPSKQLQLV